MTKRRTTTSNGLEPARPEPAKRGEELPPASVSPDDQTEVEEMTHREVDDRSTQEEDGGNEALMESYNG